MLIISGGQLWDQWMGMFSPHMYMYFAVQVDNVEFPGFSLIIANNRRWYTVLDLSGVC